MRYTLFNQDGSHAANIECHPDDAPYQAFDGRAIIEGDYGDGFYYDGEKVCEKPMQPTPVHVWDVSLRAWTLSPDLIEAAQIKAVDDVRRALQSAIDTRAASLGFSNGNALMLYVGFDNAFQAVAQVFAVWEASVWVEADAYKSEVMAGTKPMLSPSEAVAMMPIFHDIAASGGAL